MKKPTYQEQLEETEMLIQREKLYPSRKSEEVLDKLIAKKRQLLKLTKPE
jgi:hypothetical protein